MNLKTLYISAAVLAVLALAINWAAAPDKAPPLDPRVGNSLLSEAALENLDTILVEGDGQTVTIRRDAETNRWLVAERHDLPASFSKLSGQIKTLVDTNLQKVATNKAERAAGLGFDNPSAIRLKSADDQTILALEIGRSAENGRQFVRFAGEDKVFQADAALTLDTDPESWLDKKLVSIEQDKVTSLGFAFANGETLKASRLNKDTPWIAEGDLPEGNQLDQDALNRAANRLAGLTFTKTTEPAAAEPAQEHSHKISVTTTDGKEYAFTIGRTPEVKAMKEHEVENDQGEKTTELREEVETPAGPVYVSVASANADDPINGYAPNVAFEASAFQFTSLPDSRAKLLKDAPPPPAKPAEPEAEVAPAE